MFYFGVLAGGGQLGRLHEDEQSDHEKVGCNERTYRCAVDVREDMCPENTPENSGADEHEKQPAVDVLVV